MNNLKKSNILNKIKNIKFWKKKIKLNKKLNK